MIDNDKREPAEGEVSLDALIAASFFEPPALEADPAARLLGLVNESSPRLNTTELSRLRKNARLSVSQLATRLQKRGWSISPSEIFRWEMKGSADVAPELVTTIASTLDVEREQLLTDADNGKLAVLRSAPKFGELVERVAALRHLSTSVAAAMLESRVTASVYRGVVPDVDQTLQSLEELVDALERRER